MYDREFLMWLTDRLVKVYKEDEYIDFVGKLASIARATDPKKITPNMRSYSTMRTNING